VAAATERRIQEGLRRRSRTTFVITHRLTALQIVDRVILLDQGRAVGARTARELTADADLLSTLRVMEETAPLADGNAGAHAARRPDELLADGGDFSAHRLTFSRSPQGELALNVGGHSWVGVEVIPVAPLSYPERFVAVMHGGVEIGLLDDPRELDQAGRRLVSEEMSRRWLSTTVHHIDAAMHDSAGLVSLHVRTNRGSREVVLEATDQHVRRIGHRWLLTDRNGNRFEISDDSLDPQSARRLRRFHVWM
jgi:ABC-type glutathione transport system ATPase component